MPRHIPAALYLKEQEEVKVQTLKRQTLTLNIPTALCKRYIMHRACSSCDTNISFKVQSADSQYDF